MSDGCTICQHPPHTGRICGWAITETVRDDIGIFARPSGIERTIIAKTCKCGLVDSLVEQFEIDVDDLVPLGDWLNAPPLGQCNRCGRQTWEASEVGAEDRMTQPDGNPCGGRIVAT